MRPLRTRRLALRRLEGADAPALFRATGDPEVMHYWAPGPDRDVAQAAERIAQIDAHWLEHGFGDWAVVSAADGALIGFAGLHVIADMDEVNIGYVLERSRWRQGLGEELCRLLLARGFDDLDLPRIVAVIDPRNVASTGLAEKCGLSYWKRFVWTGRGRVAYSMSREEWRATCARCDHD
jgi:RimJ/RimL family protein N-acetyltransferase